LSLGANVQYQLKQQWIFIVVQLKFAALRIRRMPSIPDTCTACRDPYWYPAVRRMPSIPDTAW
jgi:hypothetical protein